MMIRHKGSVVAVVVLAALVSGGWFLQRQTEPEGSVYQQARLFDDVLAHVADYYVDSLDERQLYQMAIDGMLDQLGDPYSVFLKPDDFRQLSEATTGNYSGLGIQIDVRDGWITVVAPLPDTPAERAGVQTGDRIVQLGGAVDPAQRGRQADHLQAHARHDSHPLGRSAHHDDAQRSRGIHRALPGERELDPGRGAGDRHAEQAGDEVADL